MAKITTNLYELISVLHDEPAIDDAHIPDTVRYLAASGRIRWLGRTPDAGIHPATRSAESGPGHEANLPA